MKKMCFLAIITLFLAISADISAQNRDPHITQIQVEARNNLIRLTWTDSPDARGPVYIFRSARPFGDFIPANIRPVVVRYGEQYYIDDTEDMGNVYYFIAASDVSGRRYDLIIPRINSTSLNFIPGEAADIYVADTPVTEPVTIEGISNIRAIQEGERVVIYFDSTGNRRNIILYRSMQPIRQPQDLLNAVIVQSGISSGFIDYPVPDITWYYILIYEDEISSVSMEVKPGVNSTISPVRITAHQINERSLRPIPLPVLTIRSALPEGFITDIAEQRQLGEVSVNMLRNTHIPDKLPMTQKTPRIFAIDLQAPTGGEESALFQILTDYFINFDWENARIGLQHYLSLPRSKEVEARARFYLGQTLYYTQKYREALMEFLTFKNVHLTEANHWIDAVLSAMVY
ncbi:MAG: hypothetical protein FWC12_05800 [Treponema sp.]|nr:hypothetical protein [Treponema sp.]